MKIEAKEKDLGGFSVRRLLPYSKQRKVGPFIFFDHLGPATFESGKGLDVRPHPHINLATITYLFDGEIMHRDSLGTIQTIRPNELNLMVAGKGITHSERTPDELRERGHDVHALQLWIALPEEDEECDPAFYHYSADQIPEIEDKAKKIRLMMGEVFGLKSPVKTFSKTIYAEIELKAEGKAELPKDIEEMAIYVISGEVLVGDNQVDQHQMLVIDDSDLKEVIASFDSKFVIIGGEKLTERFIDWNFVSSRKERIEQAKQDWKNQTFDKVPDESEFIPLPE